jgi:hypothetical protein
LYDLKQKRPNLYYISETENGGEYSPQRISKSNNISAVKLDENGLQRSNSYNYKTKKSAVLIPNLKVAYTAWCDHNTLVAVSIDKDSLELFVSDLRKETSISVAKTMERSIHKIPNSNVMSFVSKENHEDWLVKSLNPITKEIETITSIGKSEDITWLPNGSLLISNGNSMYQLNPKKDKTPSLFFRFSNENINNISRITGNKTENKIALVAEVSPKYLAQE